MHWTRSNEPRKPCICCERAIVESRSSRNAWPSWRTSPGICTSSPFEIHREPRSWSAAERPLFPISLDADDRPERETATKPARGALATWRTLIRPSAMTLEVRRKIATVGCQCHVWACRNPPRRVPREISCPRRSTSCWKRESVSPPTLLFPTSRTRPGRGGFTRLAIQIVKLRRKSRLQTARSSSILIKRTEKEIRVETVARIKLGRGNI